MALQHNYAVDLFLPECSLWMLVGVGAQSLATCFPYSVCLPGSAPLLAQQDKFTNKLAAVEIQWPVPTLKKVFTQPTESR